MSLERHTAPPTGHHTVTSADGTPIGYRTLGAGPGVILVGGALRTAEDYLPLASAMAGSCTVHVVDRRGRGSSGPQGPDYGIHKEVDDLLAVQAETGARLAFGHSYGGLAVLETCRRVPVFDGVAVYEPGLPTGPVPTAWIAPYRERLAADDPHGAFVEFLRGSGGAPRVVAMMPRWYLRVVVRVAFRGRNWLRMRPLLAANLAEHEQVAAQVGRLAAFATIAAPVLLLGGDRSDGLAAIRSTLPNAEVKVMKGLNHFGPEGKTAPAVARETVAFLLGSSWSQ